MAGWSGRKWSNLIGSLSSWNPAVWTGLPNQVEKYFLAITSMYYLTDVLDVSPSIFAPNNIQNVYLFFYL
jgi:hypothetical protein